MTDFPTGGPDRTALVLMVRPPAAGRTTVQLCPPLAQHQAAELQLAMVQDALQSAAAVVDVERVLFLAPAGEAETAAVRAVVPPGLRIVTQRAVDRGGPALEAVERALAAGFGRVLLVNADCPTLPAEHLQEAVRLLENTDVVLGPLRDGGYYALGMRQPHAGLFRGIAWGTEWVVAQTLTAARTLGLRWTILPIWYDVDGAEELGELVRDVTADPAGAPFTHACLVRLGLDTGGLRPQEPFVR